MWWLPRLSHYGFMTTPLGLPQPVGGQLTLALTLEVREATLHHIVQSCRIPVPRFVTSLEEVTVEEAKTGGRPPVLRRQAAA